MSKDKINDAIKEYGKVQDASQRFIKMNSQIKIEQGKDFSKKYGEEVYNKIDKNIKRRGRAKIAAFAGAVVVTAAGSTVLSMAPSYYD